MIIRHLALTLLIGIASGLTPAPAGSQEIGAREGDTINATARGKSAGVTVRAPRPVRVEIVEPDPPRDTSYGDFELVLTKPDPKPKATAAEFGLMNEIPVLGGVFRVRVTYARPRSVTDVPVSIRYGLPVAELPFSFSALPSKDHNVFMTPVIYLNAGPQQVPASPGDKIVADVNGVTGSAAVVTLPTSGFMRDRSAISLRKDTGMDASDFDCSCKSITLDRIVSRQYTHSTGLGILGKTLHYKNSVEFQRGNFSNPPEKGEVVIPWLKKRDIMLFHFTFPHALAYIARENEQPLCRVVVELVYPHPRLNSGPITERFRLYTMQGGGGLGTASSNTIGRAASRNPRQTGPGRIRWAVGKTGGFCNEGTAFVIR